MAHLRINGDVQAWSRIQCPAVAPIACAVILVRRNESLLYARGNTEPVNDLAGLPAGFVDGLLKDISPFLWSNVAERDVNRGIDISSGKLQWRSCVAGTLAA